MDIIGCTCTGKLGNIITPSKFMTEILIKIDEKNYKRYGEGIIISKTWESNVCDGKITQS